MRLVPVLFLAATLAFAGCFGKSNNDNSGGTTTPTDVTPTSPSSGTPTGSTPATTPDANSTSTTPTTVMPKTACSASPDFSSVQPAPAGSGAIADTACNIDPGYTKLTLIVNWTSTVPQGAAPDPTGLSVAIGGATCSLPGPAETLPIASCKKDGTATPGKMAIKYTGGPAPISASVTVIES